MSAYGASYRRASHGPISTSPRHYEPVRYTGTAEYHRINGDADRYADLLDRELHLSGRQEHDIERMLVDRTRYLLRETRPSDHRHVYPFPRHERTRTTERWWNSTDRDIERMLSPRQRQDYRNLVRRLENRGGYNPWFPDRDGNRGPVGRR